MAGLRAFWGHKNMSNVRHFLKLSDFTSTELHGLVERAQQMKRRPLASRPLSRTTTPTDTTRETPPDTSGSHRCRSSLLRSVSWHTVCQLMQ